MTPAVQFHAGFLPHDMESAEFVKLADRIQVVAGIFAEKGVELVFETGQETSEDLNAFFDHLDGRGIDNVRVNFDPANMILYDKGEPIDPLLQLLGCIPYTSATIAAATCRVPVSVL